MRTSAGEVAGSLGNLSKCVYFLSMKEKLERVIAALEVETAMIESHAKRLSNAKPTVVISQAFDLIPHRRVAVCIIE
jgi:hypothetical protein